MKSKYFTKGLVILNIPVILCIGLLFLGKWVNQSINGLDIIVYAASILLLFNLCYAYVLLNLNKWVISLLKELSHITNGNIKEDVSLANNKIFKDEIVASKIQSVHSSLSHVLQNVKEISKNNLNVSISNLSEDDEIGKELLALQLKLKEDKALLEETKNTEEKRNWITAGLAKFNDILRQESENVQEMGYSILSNLVDYVGLNQAALYVLGNSEDSDVYYESIATVAYDRKKIIENKIPVGEGLVGQCAFEKKKIYMSDLPDDYINITSGLGSANPKTLLIIPCLIEDKVFGIIEVASFNEITEHQVEFIEKLGENIASSVSNFQNSERTARLLGASKTQTEELAAQEEELRQNLEEMETTQEDLQRQMELNTKMQHELKFEKFLFDTLLNNIPARINFKDADRKYIRGSKSLLERFGIDSNEELVGKTDLDFFGAEFAEKTKKDDSEIMESKVARLGYIEHEVHDNGEQIWKNVSKMPLIDDEGNCVGVFASIYDITEYKLAEMENEKLSEEIARLKKKK